MRPLPSPPSSQVLTSQEEYDEAISAWKESIALQPSSADAHTSTPPLLSPPRRPLTPPRRPRKRVHCLPREQARPRAAPPPVRLALLILSHGSPSTVSQLPSSPKTQRSPSTSPQFSKPVSNVLPNSSTLARADADPRAGGRLEESLVHYKRSKDYGVERAAMHIRNVSPCPSSATERATADPSPQVSAKILGQKLKQAEQQTQASEAEVHPKGDA